MPKTYVSPFPVEVAAPKSNTETPVSLEIAAADPESQLSSMQDILASYMGAAGAGAFSGGAVAPPSALWRVESTDTQRPGRLAYACTVYGIESGGYKALVNAIVQSHFRDEPLSLFTLKAPSARDSIGLAELMVSPYPGRWRQTPFDLDLEHLGARKNNPLIRMEFERALLDEEFDHLSRLVTNWEEILIFGGYFDSPSQFEMAPLVPGELYLATPSTVEDSMLDFQAPEEAFNGLINLACTLHEKVCPLRSLSIE